MAPWNIVEHPLLELPQPKDESQGWTGAKAMMSDVGFMRALQEYKKDQVVADRMTGTNQLGLRVYCS